ncbi:MAG: hypothetical protein Kow00114_40820 [Kiloniellaceae bacterium]
MASAPGLSSGLGPAAVETAEIGGFPGRNGLSPALACPCPLSGAQSPSIAASFMATPVEPEIFSLPVM